MQVKKCGAKTRNGTPCQNAPMKNGRCRMHGGKSLRGIESPTYSHGGYAKYRSDSLNEKIAEWDGQDLLDLTSELQTQRGLISEYLERFQAAGTRLAQSDIEAILNWLNRIGVMVERITRIRNDETLTTIEIAYLKTRIVDLLQKYIDDPEQQKAFVIELFQLDQHKRLE